MACGIFPDQGLNPCPLHWQEDSYPLHHRGGPYFPSSDCKCLTIMSRRVATSCSSGLLILSMQLDSLMSYGRERWSNSLWTKLWHIPGEFLYPYGGTVKVYDWPHQLKENCFWWSLLTGIEKKAFASSVATYQVPGDILIFSSNKTTSGRAIAIGVITWLSLW